MEQSIEKWRKMRNKSMDKEYSQKLTKCIEQVEVLLSFNEGKDFPLLKDVYNKKILSKSKNKDLEKILVKTAPKHLLELFKVLLYNNETGELFSLFVNNILEGESSLYRVVNKKLIKIKCDKLKNQNRIKKNSDEYFDNALSKISSKTSDYKGTIHDSLEAIVNVMKELTQKDTFNEAQKVLLANDSPVHPLLVSTFTFLYQNLLYKEEYTYEEAKFYLIVSMAFANLMSYNIESEKVC